MEQFFFTSRTVIILHGAIFLLAGLSLGQANYIYSLVSLPACLLASPFQADLTQI